MIEVEKQYTNRRMIGNLGDFQKTKQGGIHAKDQKAI